MNIAILSDTHGNYVLAIKVLDILGPVDRIIHLGDMTKDAELIGMALDNEPVAVSGNCDMDGKYPLQSCLEISGKKIFLTHGNLQHVKSGLTELCRKAEAEKADIVLYGHTHIPHVEKINGILYINPGTLKENVRRKSIAMLRIEGGVASAEIIEVDGILPTEHDAQDIRE